MNMYIRLSSLASYIRRGPMICHKSGKKKKKRGGVFGKSVADQVHSAAEHCNHHVRFGVWNVRRLGPLSQEFSQNFKWSFRNTRWTRSVGVCLNPMIVITVYKYNQGLFRYRGLVQLEDGFLFRSGPTWNRDGRNFTSLSLRLVPGHVLSKTSGAGDNPLA